jgi:hypothetical protein
MSATGTYTPDDGADWGEPLGIPLGLRRATAFTLSVGASGFLEACLTSAEKWLRLPRGLIHAARYFAAALRPCAIPTAAHAEGRRNSNPPQDIP